MSSTENDRESDSNEDVAAREPAEAESASEHEGDAADADRESAPEDAEGVPAGDAEAGAVRMSAGARLAAQKAAKAVVKAKKKEELRAAKGPAEPAPDTTAEDAEATAPAQVEPLDEKGILEQSELGRATLAAGSWWEQNSRAALGFLGVAAVAGLGYLGYRWNASSQAAAAGAILAEATQAALAPVTAEPLPAPEGSDEAPLSFRTATARDEAAVAAYQRLLADYPDTAAAPYARAGLGRALASLGRTDEARAAFEGCSRGPVSDPALALQCLEGLGYLLEGSDPQAAREAFERIGTLAGDDFAPISRFHLARLDLAAGDSAGQQVLSELRTSLRAESNASQAPAFPYVLNQVEERMREIEPGSGSTGLGLGPAGLPPEIQRLLQQQRLGQ